MASFNLTFAFFCILLLHILQIQAISAASKQCKLDLKSQKFCFFVASASANIKEGASNLATGTEQRVKI